MGQMVYPLDAMLFEGRNHVFYILWLIKYLEQRPGEMAQLTKYFPWKLTCSLMIICNPFAGEAVTEVSLSILAIIISKPQIPVRDPVSNNKNQAEQLLRNDT